MENSAALSDDKPEPTPKPRRGRPRVYNFDELEPESWCFIPGKDRSQVAASVAAAERRTGFALYARNVAGGVRVYRVAAAVEARELELKAARRARRLRNKEIAAERHGHC